MTASFPPMARAFSLLIDRDEDGFFVGSVPELACCHAQGRTRAECEANLRECAALCLEAAGEEVDCDPDGICLCEACSDASGAGEDAGGGP